MSWWRFKNDVEPATPPSGRTEIYVNSVTKKLCGKDDTGAVTDYSTTIEPFFSAGIYDIPTISELNGTVTVGNDGTYNLYQYADGSGVIHNYSINGGDYTPGPGGLSYIVANYNSGTPAIQLINDVSLINETTIIPIVTIYCDGIQCHILDWDRLGKALNNKLHQSIVKTQRYRRESGLSLGEQATRYVTISSGVVWVGANRRTPAAINTSVDNITFYYHVGGNWTTSTINQYNNTQYDNGTNLVTLTNDRYAVNYVYRSVDQHKDVYIVLGSGDYTLTQAQASQPQSIPSLISNTSILVGRIIVQKNASSATQIDSAFVTTFTSSGVQNHNDLSNLQGGTTDQYYHLTSTEHSYVSGAGVQALQTTASPTFAGLNINGPLIEKFTTATDTITLDATHNIIYCNKATAMTINLPAVAGCSGRIYTIKNINTGIVTIDANGSETIDGELTFTLLSRYKSVTVQSNGSAWYII